MSLITAAPALLFAGLMATAGIWAVVHSIRAGRHHNDRAAAWLTACSGERPEPGQPGTNQQLLEQCNAIYNDPARKEKPQP
ncbi:hypothetical protein ACWET9_32345 [Streptomyces sp. NPDC004059]